MSDQNHPDVLKVKDVKEEYDYVRNQTCEKCGLKAAYEVGTQKLVFREDIPYDELDSACTECGYKKTFIFNVSELFKEYSKKFGPNG